MDPVYGSVEYWAAVKPDEPAIIDENGAILTWREWNRKSDLLADALVKAGLGPNDIVAVRSQIRPEWFVINRALAKIGCAQVGLNWHFKFNEVLHVMQDSGAKAVFFDDEDPSMMVQLREELPLKILVGINTFEHPEVDQYNKLIAEREVENRISNVVTPQIIVYTSGTTGHPKGVFRDYARMGVDMIKLQEYQQDIIDSRGFKPTDNRTLVCTPLHHGLGPHNAEITHKNGDLVVLLKKFDPEKALDLIMKHKITSWTCVPTMLKRVSQLPREVLDKYDVSSLEALIVGAAPVPQSLKDWAIEYFGDHCLYEGYGASETGLVSLLKPEMQKLKPGSCGYPYKHVQVKIRNDKGEELGPGEIGIIWAKTPVTIDRYLNKTKLGSDTVDERGFFQTGDVGYLDDDGYLYIIDRIKDMIISGGVNIYPAEIEEVIYQHPAIKDVAVIGIPDEEFGEQIKAVCERKPGVAVTEEEIIDFCKERLASYKRPRTVDFVDELPKNTVGKIVKWKLREPYWKEKERSV